MARFIMNKISKFQWISAEIPYKKYVKKTFHALLISLRSNLNFTYNLTAIKHVRIWKVKYEIFYEAETAH